MAASIDAWFVEEVLPLERRLLAYLRHARQPACDLEDLRQEVFARVYEAAYVQRPSPVWPYMLMVARNLVVDRLRRAQIVPIELLADPDALGAAGDDALADRVLEGKQELARVYAAVETLPERCREVVRMRKIEGISQREVAQRLGIAEHTVEKQISKGLRRLAEALFGDPTLADDRAESQLKEARRGRTR